MKNKGFYEKTLYPLQDEVLALVDKNSKDFFLTGGTALNRFYDGWRYSDDLDFFSLREMKNFREAIKELAGLLKKVKLEYKIDTLSDAFCRMVVIKRPGELKIDFVNDPVFRYSQVNRFKQFSRVDNVTNILANKLTAISRYEVKDIVDICFITEKGNIDWQNIFQIASKKSPIEPLDVAQIVRKMPKGELKLIQWSKRVDLDQVYNIAQNIAKEMVVG